MSGRILFVSDVHLRREGAPGAAARADRFFGFLAGAAAAGATDVYVLGDLFDYWLEPRGIVPAPLVAACERLRALVARGLRIVALPGNRDFLMGRAFARATGAELAPDEIVLTLGAQRVCLLHGDALMLGMTRYRTWRRLSRGATFRRYARGLPPALVEATARLMRRYSERTKRRAPSAGVLLEDAPIVRRIRSGIDCIVAGHTHRPEERAVRWGDREGRLLVLGAWDSGRGAHAEWDGARLALVRGESG